MVRKERDSKFIIYQVLYIFVITVLALKGADLDLNRVVLKDEVVNKAVRDSLMVILDSLTSSGIKFDVKVEESALKENEQLKDRLASLNTKMKDLADKVKQTPPPEKPEEKPVVKEQEILQSPISLKQTFIQYTWNKAKNSGSVPTAIYDPKDMST